MTAVSVRVIPRAKFNKIELPKIWVTAAPTDGDANKKVIELLSDYFGVPKSKIKLIRGETSRDKVLLIRRGEPQARRVAD
jgi:uncharacterized protein YggU (UPF0235/DUF167 family)